MRIIIDVPDELVDHAVRLMRKESHDYRRRYDCPGWGWTLHEGGERFWVRGIKGGISISLSKVTARSPNGASSEGLGVPQDAKQPLTQSPTQSQGEGE